MRFDEHEFLEAVARSFQKYKEHGPRSPEKLKPLHAHIAQLLRGIWGNDFDLHCLSEETEASMGEEGRPGKAKSREWKHAGKYYPKNIDIALTRAGKPVFCLGVKFVTSNFSQNANNYFEGMMGETANVQRTEVPYAQLIVFREPTPYLKKGGAVARWEHIKRPDLEKYLRLAFDSPMAHRPFSIGICIANIDEATGETRKKTFSEVFPADPEFADLLEKRLSLSHFFEEIECQKQFYFAQQ